MAHNLLFTIKPTTDWRPNKNAIRDFVCYNLTILLKTTEVVCTTLITLFLMTVKVINFIMLLAIHESSNENN